MVTRDLLLFGFVTLLALSPCLFFGLVYISDDLLNFYIPTRLFLREQLLQGHFPLWNPYLFGGQPFFSDPNAMMVYPLNYLTLLFPVGYGLGVFYFLHMVLAAAGMNLWLKSLGLSPNASRIGALTFSLSGFWGWESIHLTVLAAYAWWPWLMFCLDRLSRRWSPTGLFCRVFVSP